MITVMDSRWSKAVSKPSNGFPRRPGARSTRRRLRPRSVFFCRLFPTGPGTLHDLGRSMLRCGARGRLLETATFQKLIGGVKRALCMSALFVCLAALESLFDRREAHDRPVFKSDVLYRQIEG
jgi:hypothetical protein